MSQKPFERLVTIMEELREKCPWDRKQTIHSLRQMTIEETYELGDAILEEDWKGIREELGDLMLHLVFYAKIASEQNKFSLDEVLEGIAQKLIHRHPHIYSPDKAVEGLLEVRTEADVKKNWEKIKLKEGKSSTLSGVPKSLPAMVKAMRLQEKAKQVGFEWDDVTDVWAKVQEEHRELEEAVAAKNRDEQEAELGDVLFSLVNYARFLGLDAEAALERTNKKFIDRFSQMEAAAQSKQKILSEMTLSEMDLLWNQAKRESE